MLLTRTEWRACVTALAVAACWAAATANAIAQGSVDADRAALEALYDATGGDGWTESTNWKTSAPLGEWHGVTTDAAGRVTELILAGNGLTGTIATALGGLDSLQRLDLGSRWDSTLRQSLNNALTGPIPAALGRLANLESLSLSGNDLTGAVPASLGNLSRLRNLNLGWNALTGEIPDTLQSLERLEWLYLASNALTGPVPAWLGNLSRLRTLHLGRNALTGEIPDVFRSLEQLERLDLSSNDLTGPVPAWLGNLSRLRNLNLGWNALAGEIPDTLRSLEQLEWLYLSSNDLTGPVPAWLGNLVLLRGLDVRSNPLTGILPQSLTRLSQLTYLNIERTRVCAPTDPEFQEWLATVDFYGETCNRPPQPVDTIPDQTLTTLGPAVSVTPGPYFNDPDDDPLTYAAASGDEGVVGAFVSGDTVWLMPRAAGTATVTVTASDPDGLSAAQSLAVATTASAGPQSDREVLEVLYDSTSGADWTASANWKTSAPLGEWYGVTTDAAGRVTELRLADNALAGLLPPALGRLRYLRILALHSNRGLTGPIPAELGGLANLEELDLGWSALSGPVPAELGSLVSLRYLWLGGNELTGPIPETLASLSRLELLSLHANHLSGPVPAWLGNFSRLRQLALGSNAFTGPIPDALENLENLEFLNLAYNWSLSGPLPAGLDLSRLDELDIFVTQACAPTAWKDRLKTSEFLARLCGTESDATIDVAVVYTLAAREAAGGAAAIAAVIDLMVAETNQAYAASGVNHRLALVERSEVAYTETGDSLVDLERFADPADGHMDEVHALRDRVGADLVHLIVDVDKADVGGRGYLPGAFGLTVHTGGGLVFAHELGHNMGLRHDRYEVHREDRGAADPAYGYVNQHGLAAGIPRSNRWRTIMSYALQCGDADIFCPWLLRFSNPDQNYNGEPLGIPFGVDWTGVTGPADGAAVLNTTGPAVALWRDRPEGANRPPQTRGTLPDRELTLPGTLDVDVSRAFADPDGDALTYTASSSAPQVVTVRAAGARVTLTAQSMGAATVWVTATDSGGLSVTQSFAVTVTPLPNRLPEPVGMLGPLEIAVDAPPVAVDVSGAFRDPDGDILTYTAVSSHPSLASVMVNGSMVTVTPVAEGITTVTVTATDPGGLRATQSFTATVTVPIVRAPFTDDPLRPGVTPVRAVHFTELRERINALRAANGLGRFRWTDPVLRAGATPVRVVHLQELRSALAAAYTAAGQSAPRWTDPAPVAGTTPIRAVHLAELRAAVVALE